MHTKNSSKLVSLENEKVIYVSCGITKTVQDSLVRLRLDHPMVPEKWYHKGCDSKASSHMGKYAPVGRQVYAGNQPLSLPAFMPSLLPREGGRLYVFQDGILFLTRASLFHKTPLVFLLVFFKFGKSH